MSNWGRNPIFETIMSVGLRLSLPELAFIAATRGIAGAGLGLLLADHLSLERRKAVGWTLFTLGAVTTLPIAFLLYLQNRDRGVSPRRALSDAPAATLPD
jgi:hypothetical protein